MAAKYEQVLKSLSQRISGLEAGTQLPTENQLAQEFGVSNMTVRRALQVLASAKRIVGVRGKGTFVAQPTVTKRMVLASFTESMQMAGMTARAEVLSASLGRAVDADAQSLDVSVGDPIIKLTRLRFGDETPLCIDNSMLREEAFPGLLGNDLTGSLYDIFLKKYGTSLSRAESTVSAVHATKAEAELLGITPNTPCLRVQVRGLTSDGRTAEFTNSLYRGDLYELSIAPE